MDIKDIRYVMCIVRLASFTKAAKELFISQPALSQSVKRLEKELGCPLFLRDRNHVIPTEAALLLAQHGGRIVREFDELYRELGNTSGEKQSISLGISQFYGHHILSFLFSYLAKEEPLLKIRVVEGESHFLEQQIIDGVVDVGIFPAPIYRKELIQVPLYEEEILLAIHEDNTEAIALANKWCSPYLVGEKEADADMATATPILRDKDKQLVPLESLAEFRQFPFILLRKGLKLRTLVETISHSMGFEPQVIMETENLDTCAAFVESNYGVSFLPSTLAYTKERKHIKYFHIPIHGVRRQLMLVYRAQKEGQLPIQLLTRLARKRFELQQM